MRAWALESHRAGCEFCATSSQLCSLELGTLSLSYKMGGPRAGSRHSAPCKIGFGIQEPLLRPSPAQDATGSHHFPVLMPSVAPQHL